MASQVFLERSEIALREDAGTAEAWVVRIGDLSGAAEVLWATVGDSAAPGEDYVQSGGVVRFEPGQDRAAIRVPLLDDDLAEATEVFSISLINAEGAALLAPRTGRVAILDDEAPVADPVAAPPLSPWNTAFETVFRGLDQPIRMVLSPLDPTLAYVAEKPGRVQVLDLASGEILGPLLDLTATTNAFGDRGLLGIALHPDLAANPYLYVFRVIDPPEVAGADPGTNAAFDGGGNRFSWLSRFTLDLEAGREGRVVEGSEVLLLGGAGRSLADLAGGGALDYTDPAFVDATASDRLPGEGARVEGILQDFLKMDSRSHAGGALAFAPDGSLLVSTGDGTSFDIADPRSFDVQSIHSLSGKILRIDPLTGQGLADNPFAGPEADLSLNAAKVWQLGLRNPFSLAVAPDGRTVITDTGWFSWESVHAAGAGANFAWPYVEGSQDGVPIPAPGYRELPEAQAWLAALADGTLAQTPTLALAAFPHDSALPGFQVQAITGGSTVYAGGLLPAAFRGDYFFSDFPQGEIFSIDVDDATVQFLGRGPSGFGMTDFAAGPDGSLWWIDLVGGQIGRLRVQASLDADWNAHGAARAAGTEAGIAAWTLTSAIPGQIGHVATATRLDVRQDVAFTLQFRLPADMAAADGLAVVLHADPRGAAAQGWGGGGLGAWGVAQGIGLEIDVFRNGADAPFADLEGPHAAVFRTDASFQWTPAALPAVEDGLWHELRLSWNAAEGALSWTLDGRSAGRAEGIDLVSILGGQPFAHLAVAAANGGTPTPVEIRIGALDARPEAPDARLPVALAASGDARALAPDAFVLTGDAAGQTGRVASLDRLDLRSDLRISFEVQASARDGAGDGLAVALHADPRGALAEGWGGGGFGVAGIARGIALEIDLFDNGAATGWPELAADHMALWRTDQSFQWTPAALPNLEDGLWRRVEMAWDADAQVLSWSLDGRLVGQAGLDLVGDALEGQALAHLLVGASSGGAGGAHRIRDLRIEGEAETAWTASGDAARAADGSWRLVGEAAGQQGMIAAPGRIDIRQAMSLQMEIRFPDLDAGADGLAIVLHADPRGAAATGWGGGGFGAGGIRNGIGAEIDVFDNGAATGWPERAEDHAGFFRTDWSFQWAPAALPEMETGTWRAVRLDWTPEEGLLTLAIDGVERARVDGIDLAGDVLGGSPYAWLVLTAANGGTPTPIDVRPGVLDALLVPGDPLWI